MTNEQLHRIDKFAVPAGALEEFLDRARQTHQLLAQQPGIVRNAVIVSS